MKTIYILLTLCLSLGGCREAVDDDPSSTAGERGGASEGGDEGGAEGGAEGGETGGMSTGGELGGELGGGAGSEERGAAICGECEADEDCLDGATCFAMDGEGEQKVCIQPCGTGGTCDGPNENCTTLSHDLSLYVCVPAESCSFCYDQDGDGYGNGPGCVDTDCDDQAAEINRGMSDDTCNGVDNDCNGLIDEDITDLVCAAYPAWRILNADPLGDAWQLHELILYADDACTQTLNPFIQEIIFSASAGEQEATLNDENVEGALWSGGADENDLNQGGTYVGYTFPEGVEVGCVDAYQSSNPDSRQMNITLEASQGGGEWLWIAKMFSTEREDRNGVSMTRFLKQVCGNGAQEGTEECDLDAEYCIDCQYIPLGEGDLCSSEGEMIGRCEDELICVIDETQGQCLPVVILSVDDPCDLDDPTARCDEDLFCLNGPEGIYRCVSDVCDAPESSRWIGAIGICEDCDGDCPPALSYFTVRDGSCSWSDYPMTDWGYSSNIQEEESNEERCADDCLATAGCTGFESSEGEYCAYWFNSACDVNVFPEVIPEGWSDDHRTGTLLPQFLPQPPE
jgi:hypothetical protein